MMANGGIHSNSGALMPIATKETMQRIHKKGSLSLTANQLPVIRAGHFLYTSESVGEGHPGITNICTWFPAFITTYGL